MKKLLIVFLLTGCTQTQIRLGVLHDYQGEMEGGPVLGIIEIQQPVTDNITCGFMHLSHIFTGVPFNREEETTIDSIGCFLTMPPLPGIK